MTRPGAPGREEILSLLAQRHGQAARSSDERVDSLDLAWVLYAVEERYGVELELPDEALERMTTVTGLVEVFGQYLGDGTADDGSGGIATGAAGG